MDDLIICALQGRAKPEEEETLRRWRKQDSNNERRYRRLEEVWSLVGAAEIALIGKALLNVDAVIGRAEIDADASRGKHDPASVALPGPAPRRPTAHQINRWTRRSATGLLAAGVAILGFGLGTFADRSTSSAQPLGDAEIITGADERVTINLADGTAIRLGPRSHLRITEEGGHPVAWLDGRAFFGVEPDPSRTFTVRTDYGEATALGTRFEVRAEDQEFQVLVVEGNVRVSVAGDVLELGEGIMSRNREGASPSASRVENVGDYLDWMGNTLVFRSTPLRRAKTEIEHRYGVELVLDDASLGDLEITATFIDQGAEAVVFVICEIVGAECASENGRFRLKRITTGEDIPTLPS